MTAPIEASVRAGVATETSALHEAAPLHLARALAAVETLMEQELQSDDPLLAAMAKEVTFAGGKRLRPRVTLLAYAACGGREVAPGRAGDDAYRRVIEAAAAFELIHTATLVHDDIIDQSSLRRGKPTLHTQYGIGQAIVAGDFLFTRGFGLSGRLGPRCIQIATEACTRLAEGEVLEQRLAGGEDLPMQEYLKIIAKKTAYPIKASAMVGGIVAGASDPVVRALGNYGLDLGIAFQIWDDLLDVSGDPTVTGKPVGLDAAIGVMTLPAIFARADTNDALPQDPAERRRLLESSGAVARAEAVALNYVKRARGHLSVLPKSEARLALEGLAESAVGRKV